MSAQDALWSAQEVRTQAEQVRGQVDIFDALDVALAMTLDCSACGAEGGEPCNPFCIGLAAMQDES